MMTCYLIVFFSEKLNNIDIVALPQLKVSLA
jgi:hypothetical protein